MRERERERERQTDRQTDRQTETETETETETQRERQRERVKIKIQIFHMCLHCPRFGTINFARNELSLCVCLLNPSNFSRRYWVRVRKFIFAVISLYRCYTIILIQFLYRIFKVQ